MPRLQRLEGLKQRNMPRIVQRRVVKVAKEQAQEAQAGTSTPQEEAPPAQAASEAFPSADPEVPAHL